MNINPDTLLKVLNWLVKLAPAFRIAMKVGTNPIFKYGMIILVVSYLLYWLGFTKDLMFMMPFR